LEVAVVPLALGNRREKSSTIGLILKINTRPLLVCLESLLKSGELRSGDLENVGAISETDDTLFGLFDLIDLFTNEALLLDNLSLDVLLEQGDVLVLRVRDLLEQVRERVDVRRHSQLDVVAIAHRHEVSETALRLLTLSDFLSVRQQQRRYVVVQVQELNLT
jgi:hypothetical protein